MATRGERVESASTFTAGGQPTLHRPPTERRQTRQTNTGEPPEQASPLPAPFARAASEPRNPNPRNPALRSPTHVLYSAAATAGVVKPDLQGHTAHPEWEFQAFRDSFRRGAELRSTWNKIPTPHGRRPQAQPALS
jgi:hypothetical protein